MQKRSYSTPWTLSELARVDAWRHAGLRWDEVAERLDCSQKGISLAFYRWKSGQRTGAYEKRLADDARIEKFASEDLSVREMAIAMRTTKGGMSNRLRRLGLDLEMRLELRAVASEN